MTKRVYVESLGCDANQADGWRVQAMCEAAGWSPVSDPANADMIFVMTCGFTTYQEGVNLRRISELQGVKADHARLVVGGCLPSINKEAVRRVHDGLTFGPRTLDRVRLLLSTTVPQASSITAVAPSEMEPGVGLVRVATGCLDRCTYCAIPFANGRIRSRPLEEIEGDIRAGFDKGYRVFHLVSEDIGAWGQDRAESLLTLLDHLLELPLPVRFRLHNLNPNWLRDMIKPLLERLSSERIVRRFYIPIQSGSDAVLKRMARRYTAEDVRDICRVLRAELPGVLLSSDWIVGFPAETDDEFEQTRRLFVELDHDFASIYKFEARPRTQAASCGAAVDAAVKEERARVLIADMLALLARRHGVDTLDGLAELLAESDWLPINTNIRMDLPLPMGIRP